MVVTVDGVAGPKGHPISGSRPPEEQGSYTDAVEASRSQREDSGHTRTHEESHGMTDLSFTFSKSFLEPIWTEKEPKNSE